MKRCLKQFGMILTFGFILLTVACKKAVKSEKAPAQTVSVETLSEKAKDMQKKKSAEAAEAIARAKTEAEEKIRIEEEAARTKAALMKERLQREAQRRTDSLAAIERERIASIEREEQARQKAAREKAEREREKAERERVFATRKCKPKTFKNTSEHSWVEFRLPNGNKDQVIQVKSGAYNNYVFPKCNRVWWNDLTFKCDDATRIWKKISGKWDADALCHGGKGNSPYVVVGNR